MADLRAFDAKRAQCSLSLGNPSKASSISSGDMFRATSAFFPFDREVTMLPEAILVPQPSVVKEASVMIPS